MWKKYKTLSSSLFHLLRQNINKLFVTTIKLESSKVLIFQTKSLQCYWIRRLYDNSFHEWKLILLYLIRKSFGTSFKFHSNLLFKSNKTKFFPSFSGEIILNWKKRLAMITEMHSNTIFFGTKEVSKRKVLKVFIFNVYN